MTPIYYFKKTKMLPLIYGLAAVIQVLVTYILIRFNGIEGAAWANFLTKMVQVFLVFIFVRRFYSFSVNPQKFIVYPVIYILILLATDLFFSDINVYLIASLHLVILSVVGFLMFKKEIVPFVKSLYQGRVKS
jgi:O-antigen/teichoic acid export membrane protein